SGKLSTAGVAVNTGNPQQREYKEKQLLTVVVPGTMTGTSAILNEYNKYHGKILFPLVMVKAEFLVKDETSGILKTFITEIENQLDHKVKVIRSDNGTEFKNSIMNQFCEMKGIKREFSVARTPQQTCQAQKEKEPEQEYILIPLCTTDPLISQGPKDCKGDAGMKPTEVDENEASDKSGKHDQEARSESERLNQREMQTEHTNSSNGINTVSTPVSTAGPSFDTAVPSTPVNTVGPSVSTANESEEQLFERFSPFKNAFTLPPIPNISSMDNTGIFRNAYRQIALVQMGVLETQRKDERGIVVKNKARLVAQGYTQEEDRKKVYVCQPPCLQFPNKVYKVEKALYGLHQAPRAWYETLSTYLIENGFRRGTIDKTLFIKKDKGDILLVQVYVDDIIFGSTKKSLCDEFEGLMHKRFQMSSIGELTLFLGLQVQQKKDGIFISQEKYVADILKKFDFATVKTTSTPMEPNKALIKDEEADSVDVHLYRSMIGSLIYLKGQPKLGLWYPRDSPFDLEAFSDSDYARASLDRKSTTRAKYVAAANCCGQNPVFHSKTKHIEIRHHFIRDSYEKKLIQVIKIHTDHNVTDLLTKAFDVKSSIRSNLHLEDADGIDCLPTATIFEELARICAKTTAWNEFSSTMASTIICLATNQKFNLSKYIFDAMLGDMSHHKKIYVNPSHTKKIFSNMKGEGKDFSGRVTPLFATMMVQAYQEEGIDSSIPAASKQTPITIQPSTSKPQKKHSRRKQKKTTTIPHPSDSTADVPNKESVPTHSNDPLLSALEITNLKLRVKKLEKKIGLRTHKFKRLYKVGVTRRVEYSDDESLNAQEDAFNQGRSIEDIDKDAKVSLADETQRRSDDAEMFDTDALIGNEVFAENDMIEKDQDVIPKEVSTVAPSTTAMSPPVITEVEITLAQTLAKLKGTKSKVMIQEPVQSTATTAP
ncbi:putative ribonuclease H-like domain-containing protein, partial [Tanacetum coccineum]